MKFQDLPGMPRSWIDFTTGKYPEMAISAIPYKREFLHTHLDRVKRQSSLLEKPLQELISDGSLRNTPPFERIRQLQQSDSVAVIVNVEAGVLGGALSQILKCLTAVKVCNALAKHSIEAVPVCWIYAPRPAERDQVEPVRILDSRSELHRLNLQPDGSVKYLLDPDPPFRQAHNLIRQIENIGKDSFDPEILETLKAAYTRDATRPSACADLFTDLMGKWGMVVVDLETPGLRSQLYEACMPLLHQLPREDRSGEKDYGTKSRADDPFWNRTEFPQDYFIQNSLLPIFVRIISPDEISSYAQVHPDFKSFGLVPPIAWPASSATLIDVRRRKILEKYAIGIPDLLNGEEEVLRCLQERINHPLVKAKLDSIKSEVERHIDELNDPDMDCKAFRKVKKQCRERIAYQLDKIKDRVESARQEKQRVMRRQVRYACGFLAPDGILQETGLTGIALPLRYSRSILSFLYENLDIMKFEHQLIYLE